MKKSRPRSKSRRPDRHPTIRDVAAAANVSVATVSRVFNEKDIVREVTSARVREVARTLGFVPNVAARALSVRRAHTIGVLLPDVHGEFFSEVIRAVDMATRAAGFHILLSGWHSDVVEMMAMINAFRGRVDGLLLMAPDATPSTVRRTISVRVPIVLLNSAVRGQHSSITVDNAGGARGVIRHLRELGHRRIAFIQGPPQNADARERLRGCRQAIKNQNDASLIEVPGDFTEDAGCDAVGRILEAKPRPTAVFAANDSMAIGVLGALAERGVKVPEEMSVVGFDDIVLARHVTPPLTTVRVDVGDLGRRAVALLLETIGEGGAGCRARSASRPSSSSGNHPARRAGGGPGVADNTE